MVQYDTIRYGKNNAYVSTNVQTSVGVLFLMLNGSGRREGIINCGTVWYGTVLYGGTWYDPI